jgi:hypothetical protein
VIAIQVALTHPFDTTTSPLHSMRYEHREHALAWLAEKQKAAGRQHRWVVVGTWAAIIAAITGVITAWPVAIDFLRPWLN